MPLLSSHRARHRPDHPARLSRRRLSSSLSPAAAAAYSDASRAAAYDALRPAYPSDLLAEATSRAPPDGTLVDLGAGAGRLTRALLELPSVRPREVLAVEPAVAMRGAFAAKGASCVHGYGDSIPVENGNCAAVFCGESFHWMASIATLQEVYRVLSRDGVLVLLWNTRDPCASGFAMQLEQSVISPLYADGTPRQQRRGAWERTSSESMCSASLCVSLCVPLSCVSLCVPLCASVLQIYCTGQVPSNTRKPVLSSLVSRSDLSAAARGKSRAAS